MTISFTANSVAEMKAQMLEFLNCIPGSTKVTEVTEIKPVLTQEQMAQNVANAPKHVDPPQPTLEEVRAAMKGLLDRKGRAAVKELLAAFKASSVPDLKPEDYLGVIDRARAEA